jgi:hypothetical protein
MGRSLQQRLLSSNFSPPNNSNGGAELEQHSRCAEGSIEFGGAQLAAALIAKQEDEK